MSAELVRDIRYRNKPQAGLAQLISALRMPLQRGQSHHVDPPPAAGSSLLGNLESPLTALVQNVSEGKKRKANTLFWIAALKRLSPPPSSSRVSTNTTAGSNSASYWSDWIVHRGMASVTAVLGLLASARRCAVLLGKKRQQQQKHQNPSRVTV